MALNYSHRPIFPTHTAEDNLVSPMRIVNGYLVEGVPERNGEGFNRYLNREIDNRARVDRCGSPESMSKDIIDLLPSDPFGMDMSTTVTAITGWLEDLEVVDYFGKSIGVGACKEEYDYDLFADLNMILNNAMKFQTFPGNNIWFDERSQNIEGNRHDEKRDLGDGLTQYNFESFTRCDALTGYVSGSLNQHDVSNLGDVIAQYSSGSASNSESSSRVEGKVDEGNEGDPHQALDFAVCYLGLKDLLLVERVCRHLYAHVRSDNSLWKCIHIDQPLNEKITDDILLQLTSRAQGNLQSLTLVECQKITDDGLRRVLETNPRLTKLCVPGCTRLSIAAVVNNVKAFNSKEGTLGIKHLRIGGLYGLTPEHFEELKVLLGADKGGQNGHKPRIFHWGNFYLLCDDDRAIDVETCPRCEKQKLVYDCPAKDCQTKDHTSPICRACTLCIPRCFECGRCVNDNEYEETFTLDKLCAECFKQLPKCPEKPDQDVGPA